MPRTDLPVTASLSRDGIDLSQPPTEPANADGHTFKDNGRRLLRVANADSADHVVTIPTPGVVDGLAVADRLITVPASTGDVLIGPFTGAYRHRDQTVWVDFDDPTGLTVALYELPIS